MEEITMTQQLKGAILCAVVAVVFLALQIAFGIQTGTAGVFVMGVAGGLLVANQMTRPAPAKAARGEVVPPQPLRQH